MDIYTRNPWTYMRKAQKIYKTCMETYKEINKQIASLQQPGSAYWDKRNPNHSEAVQEVQELLLLGLEGRFRTK